MNLKALLKTRELRMVDLARRLGVDKATITRWSKGEVPADRVGDVSAATGIPASVLRPDLANVFKAAS